MLVPYGRAAGARLPHILSSKVREHRGPEDDLVRRTNVRHPEVQGVHEAMSTQEPQVAVNIPTWVYREAVDVRAIWTGRQSGVPEATFDVLLGDLDIFYASMFEEHLLRDPRAGELPKMHYRGIIHGFLAGWFAAVHHIDSGRIVAQPPEVYVDEERTEP